MSVKRTSIAMPESSGTIARSTRAAQSHGKEGIATGLNGTRKGRTTQKHTSQGDEEAVTEEMFSEVRDASLAMKQSELDATYNVHDDYVRQLFHLQSLGTCLGLTHKHQQEAKQDSTAVFKEFKEPYDLIGKTVPTSGTRRTRGAISQVLSSAPISIPSISATPSTSKSRKRNPRSSTTWDIIAEAHRAREQLEAVKQQTDELADLAKETEHPQLETDNRKARRKGKEKVDVTGTRPDQPVPLPTSDDTVEDAPLPTPIAESISVVVTRRKREAKEKDDSVQVQVRKAKKSARIVDGKNDNIRVSPRKVEGEGDEIPALPQSVPDDTVNVQQKEIVEFVPLPLCEPEPQVSEQNKPLKELPFQATQSMHENGITKGLRVKRSAEQPVVSKARFEEPTLPVALKAPEPRTSSRLLKKPVSITAPPITQLPIPKTPLETPKPAPIVTTPSSGIKRVKLIVRRPLPTLSNPLQRPSPAKHKESLEALLSSYTSFNGNDDKDAREEAKIREREYLFGRQGRFIPDTEALFGTEPPTEEYISPKRVTVDIWDEIIDTVAKVHKKRSKVSVAKQGAGQVAKIVQSYWDKQEATREKARAQEERRLRKLAEATMKMVTEEWKKAVFHIREKERLKVEEEERRRGHEHLDAILDQSGQILQTQQGDLYRSRSQSASTSDHLLGWNSETDEEESRGDADEDEDEDDGDQTSDMGGEVERDEDEGVIPDGDVASLRESSEGTSGTSMTDDDNGTANLLSFSNASVVQEQLEEDSSIPFTVCLVQDALTDKDLEVPTPRAQSPSGSPSMPASIPAAERTLDIDMDDTPVLQVEDDSAADVRPEQDLPICPREDVYDEIGDNNKIADVDSDDESEEEVAESVIPDFLKPYAVAPVDWDPSDKIKPPLLLRGVLRPYQFSGLEWLASLHARNVNGILADEMGLGKTIQTISLLAHLACDRGIWGPHLIVVPTSVILNWEMEFKKFLPGFKILSYHGSTIRRKELRKGWNDKYHFNVCITSYALASRDAHIFKRKPWYYMILDEAHMIKNFKSQRWNILLMFRSFRRLLLTGTPLQNNLTELWALLQFLMSGSNFANLREFGEWFSNPLEKAIETGNTLDDDTMQRVNKLHTVLRPYLLRRLKRDVEKELPHKYDHLVLCPLSKRQRFLYDEFMSRAETRDDLQSGVYQKIANILMQLRKVCNHPDLFEVRPIELLIRKRFFEERDEYIDLDVLGLQFIDLQNTPLITALETRRLNATSRLPYISDMPGEPPPKDTRTIAGWRTYSAYMERAKKIAHWSHVGYLNRLRCDKIPIYSQECLRTLQRMTHKILPFSAVDTRCNYMSTVFQVNRCIKSYAERAEIMASSIDRFAFVTPTVDSAFRIRNTILSQPLNFDDVLHRTSVKLQIAFPDPSLLQYDCGKLQQLTELLREKKAGGHRVLIFTQMTRILDILEIFLNFHGYLYLRLDGATKIEDRQYITERFNADSRVFCFISSSRSGGVGINLTGADTVIFYDSDFNPQMDRQCEDRAHRIGQIRDVHIYRFVSQYTVEEAMLRKANQKRSLDDLVIQKGEFDWRTLFNDEGALTKALGEVEDTEDAIAAAAAAKEAFALEGADEADFGADATAVDTAAPESESTPAEGAPVADGAVDATPGADADEEEEEGGTVVDYMVTIVERDYEDFFKDWRL
ncbi:SNF2 family N-terminal domain-containing protein [Cyathus striatus]|nr:SNF2 family N-terminal domain-containing protein [Cyathus striatus]